MSNIFSGVGDVWKNLFSDGYQFGDIISGVGRTIGTTSKNAIQGITDQLGMTEGIENWWNKNTGNSHLTPESQYQAQREDTSIQRQAADAEAAGYNKISYAGSSGASSSAPISSNDVGAVASRMLGSVLDLPTTALNLVNAVSQVKERNATTNLINAQSSESKAKELLYLAQVPNVKADTTLKGTQASQSEAKTQEIFQDIALNKAQADVNASLGFGPQGPYSDTGKLASDLALNPKAESVWVDKKANEALNKIISIGDILLNFFGLKYRADKWFKK